MVRVPPMAESINEGTLNQFTKQVGDFIELDEELATIETDKIDVSVNASQAGIIEKLLVSEGDTVTVDQPIAEIFAGEQSNGSKAKTHCGQNEKDEQHVIQQEPPAASASPAATPLSATEPAPPAAEPKETPEEATGHPPELWGIRPSRGEQKVGNPSSSVFHRLLV